MLNYFIVGYVIAYTPSLALLERLSNLSSGEARCQTCNQTLETVNALCPFCDKE